MSLVMRLQMFKCVVMPTMQCAVQPGALSRKSINWFLEASLCRSGGY